MQDFFRTKSKYFYLALAVVIFVIVTSIIYHQLNKAPQKWDSAAHINLTMLYAEKIREGRFSELPTLSGYYPPLIHLIGSLWYLLVPQMNAALVLSFVFFVIGLMFLFKLAKELSNDDRLGYIAVILFALLPQAYIELRLFELDLPLTVLLVTSTYYLHKSQKLSLTKYALLFFVFAGFAQLTKWYAFVYLVVPFLYEMIFRDRDTLKWTKKAVRNLGVGVLIGFLLTIPWYYANYKTILDFFGSVASLGELNDPDRALSIASFVEYFQLTWAYQISFPMFLIVIVGTAYLFVKRKKHTLYFVMAIAVPWIVFTLLKNKDIRYIMPVLPYMSLLLAYFLISLYSSRKKVYYLIFGGIMTYLLVVYMFLSFNQIKTLEGPAQLINDVFASPINKYKWLKWNTSEFAYSPSNWGIEEMYNYMLELDKYKDKNGTVLFAVDYPYFNGIIFNTLQIHNETYYNVKSGYDIYYLELNEIEVLNNFDVLKSFDYIVTGYNPGYTDLRHYENMVTINRFLQRQGNEYFVSKGSWNLPNGEEIYLFRRKDLDLY